MKKILVTGSEGSLGSEIVARLLARGCNVRGVDTLHRKNPSSFAYEYMHGDLRNADFVKKVMTDDVVGLFHCAAEVNGVAGMHLCPATIMFNNTEIDLRVVGAAARKNVEFISQMSSSIIYEMVPRLPFKEEDVDIYPSPRTGYLFAKLYSERSCQAVGEQYGQAYSIWRPFNMLSPKERSISFRGRRTGFNHVYADFIRMLVVEKMNPLPLIGDGEQVRCFSWIGDVADGIVQHSFSERSRNTIFNLGNPEPITMKQLALLIYEEAQGMGLLPSSLPPLKFTTVKSFGGDLRNRVPDITRAKTVLGWEPKVGTREAIRKCLTAVPDLYFT